VTVTLLTFSWVCAPPPHSTHTFGSIRTGFLPWSCPRRPPDDFNFATEKSGHLFDSIADLTSIWWSRDWTILVMDQSLRRALRRSLTYARSFTSSSGVAPPLLLLDEGCEKRALAPFSKDVVLWPALSTTNVDSCAGADLTSWRLWGSDTDGSQRSVPGHRRHGAQSLVTIRATAVNTRDLFDSAQDSSILTPTRICRNTRMT